MSNHLKNAASPYLLQHSEKPVNRYSQCDEAYMFLLSKQNKITDKIIKVVGEGYYEKTMEAFCFLPCRAAFDRRSFSAFDTKRYADIRHADQAEARSAGLAVSGRLDYPVYSHGDSIVLGYHIGKNKPFRYHRILASAYIQLLLVNNLF